MNIFNNADELEIDFSVVPPKEEPKQEEVELPPITDETVETKEEKEVADKGLNFDEEKEEEEDGEETTLAPELQKNLDLINNLASRLAEKGLQLEAYEGWSEDEDPTDEVVFKMIEHNFDRVEERAVEDLYEQLNPISQRILNFDINGAKEEEVLNFVRALVEEKAILNLDPENEYDQERIVRSFYSNDKWSAGEIDEKLSELKEAGLLKKEASRLKPKLDAVAQEVAKAEEEGKRVRKEIENSARADYYSRLEKTLEKGNLAGITPTKEELGKLFKALTAEDMEVPVHGGNKVKMDFLNALIFQHRYSKKGDLEALAMATQVLLDKEGFLKNLSKTLENKVTTQFVKDHKYSSSIKSGQRKEEETAKPKSKDKLGKNIGWNFAPPKSL